MHKRTTETRTARMTDEEIELIAHLYDHNVSVAHIASYFSRDASTIFRLLKDLRLTRDKSMAKIVKKFYVEKGITNPELCRFLNKVEGDT